MPTDHNIELHKREVKAQKDAQAATKALIDATNIMGMDEQVATGIFNGIITSHPTLRQSFVRCLVDALAQYGEIRGDARDQGARELAKRIGEMERNLPFI